MCMTLHISIHEARYMFNVFPGSGGSHYLSHRYPRHLHDPSVYSENQFSGHSSASYNQPQPFQPPIEMMPANLR